MKPTERFTGLVDDYVRHRPGYPPAALEPLVRECGLDRESTVADVGAGTGIWTGRLTDAGCRILALEPNREMRRAGRRRLGAAARVTWLDGTAEATGLADGSVDLVTAAQAFHWFDRPRARAELARALRPGGWMAVIWNERHKATTPFLAAYERLLLDWAIDYERIDHSRIGREDMAAFFAPATVEEHCCANRQLLDLAALEGRLRSCSYTPPPDHPSHGPMFAGLRRLFASCQEGGRVAMDYDCRIYYGRLG